MKVFINNEEKPILTRKYQFTRADDYKVIIQDHGAGHKYSAPGNIGDQKAQLNLRPINNPRTGKIPDARDHFYFKEKMKFWNNVDGSIFLNKVFSTLIPIGPIELFAINIDNNRNNINIEFDIDEIPDIIPAKWLKHEFNTCRIGLDCRDIKNLSIKNIPTTK